MTEQSRQVQMFRRVTRLNAEVLFLDVRGFRQFG
jgi:hypothetical protein